MESRGEPKGGGLEEPRESADVADVTEIAVVGAGVAGLAAARDLARQGLSVVVLEARERIGGRILTLHDERVPLPIELGAEFLHGDTPETDRLLAAAGQVACDVDGESWRAARGRLRPAEDYWRRVDRVLQRIDPEGPDRSAADFLAARPGGRALARDRTLARRFVQGFHAADPADVGVRSLAGASTAAARYAGRVVEGYDGVPRQLARELAAAGGALRLGVAVTAVRWSRGAVELALRPGASGPARLTARAAVVAVPLGVLQAPPDEPGGIRLEPDPPRLRETLGRLGVGSALRVVCWFRELPWEGRLPSGRSLERLGFLHLPDEAPVVWWTARPLRGPLAVAWTGGPPAAELARAGDAEIVAQALRRLAEHLGVSRRRVESRLVDAWTYDWDGDPFARGAYSYARVGGSEAAKSLARPIAGTLFFAGEATDVEGRTGTVEGAIASGRRAAHQASRALARSR
jgi:monoamine oxidase